MAVTAGSIRFNTDSSKMEIYNGDKWWEVDSTSPYEQTGGDRGLLSGGYINAPVSQYNGDIIRQQIDPSKLVPLLTAALKEAITKIETLETKVAALESS